MSKPFCKLKIMLGMDDTIPFGKYQGMKISDLVQDAPMYLSWVINNTNAKFYQSVKEAVDLRVPKHVPRGATGPWFYDGRLRGEMAHYHMEQIGHLADTDLEGWIDDVPF